jgi:hypothetical protein
LAPFAAVWSDPECSAIVLLSETSIGAGRTWVSLKSFSNPSHHPHGKERAAGRVLYPQAFSLVSPFPPAKDSKQKINKIKI